VYWVIINEALFWAEVLALFWAEVLALFWAEILGYVTYTMTTYRELHINECLPAGFESKGKSQFFTSC